MDTVDQIIQAQHMLNHAMNQGAIAGMFAMACMFALVWYVTTR